MNHNERVILFPYFYKSYYVLTFWTFFSIILHHPIGIHPLTWHTHDKIGVLSKWWGYFRNSSSVDNNDGIPIQPSRYTRSQHTSVIRWIICWISVVVPNRTESAFSYCFFKFSNAICAAHSWALSMSGCSRGKLEKVKSPIWIFGKKNTNYYKKEHSTAWIKNWILLILLIGQRFTIRLSASAILIILNRKL